MPEFNLESLEKIEEIENEEQAPAEKELCLWSMQDLLEHDFGKEQWLVKPLIPLQGITAFSGNPGHYKTWLTLELARSIASGTPLFGKFPVMQGAVLMVDEENHLRHIKQRLRQLGVSGETPIYYLSQNSIKIDNDDHLEKIMSIARDKKILLVIFDSLIRIHTQEENDARGMARVFERFQQLAASVLNILFTHHHRKKMNYGPSNPSQSLRGSSDILAAVDCHLTVEKLKDQDRLIVTQTKLRQGETMPPFTVKIQKDQDNQIRFVYVGPHDETKTKTDQAKKAIKELLSEERVVKRKDIIGRLKGPLGRNVADNALKKLLESHEIERVPKKELSKEDQQTHYYRLP